MLVAGEEGKALRLNAAIALSDSTSRRLTIKRPDGSTRVVDDPNTDPGKLPVGPTDVTTAEGLFRAGEYITYAVQNGDFPVAGRYQLKLQAQLTGQLLRSVYKTIEVEE